MTKCKSADRYKAEQPPRCNNGRPCETCKAKWESRHRAWASIKRRMAK